MISSICARLLDLEHKVEQILARLAALLGRLVADEQQLAQLWGAQPGGSSGGPGLYPVVYGSGIAAGTLAAPATASATLVVVSGSAYTTSGGTSITVSNYYTTAVTGTNKFGFVCQRGDGQYVHVVGDC